MKDQFQINNIINHINSVKRGANRKNGICVLIGAGADLTSGGILFRDLKILFLKENGNIVPSNIDDKQLDEEFEQQVDKLSQDGRCETLDKIMRKHCNPSEGYLLLVMLAELGYIDYVITTNFDYLLEETQDSLNLHPFTVFNPAKAIPGEYYLNRSKISPVYLKMHGDLSDRLVTHLTQSEINNKQYRDEFIKFCKHIVHNNSLLIVGYGGYDKLITEIIKQEIDDINEVYWCNIREPRLDSDLVKKLQKKNKLYYVNTSFDNLFQELAKTFLREAKFKNVNPVFLPTVIRAKIENQKIMFEEKIQNRDKLIYRADAHNVLEDFFQTLDKKLIAIIGEKKFGKSSFLYKEMQQNEEITFFPITCQNDKSILENIVQALGYDTDVSFPIMYSFLKWWNETKGHLVFVIDDFLGKDFSVNNIIEFLNFVYIAKDFKFIQFIICFQSDFYDDFKKISTLPAFRNIISDEIMIRNFSKSEVEKLLDKYECNSNLRLSKSQVLLSIPYVWDILSKNKVDKLDADFFNEYTNSLFDISLRKYNFSMTALKKVLIDLAYFQIFKIDMSVEALSQECTFLREEGIIDQNNEIVYPEMATFFCKKHFFKSSTWEEVIKYTIFPDILVEGKLSEMQLEVYISILAEVENIDMYGILLKNLDQDILRTSTLYPRKIVFRILQRCFEVNNKLFNNYLKKVNLNTYSSSLQRFLFKTYAEYAPDILQAWEMNIQNDDFSYVAFILDNDNLYKLLLSYFQNKDKKNTLLNHFKNKNGLIKIWHILTYFGWDNLCLTDYEQLINVISTEIFPIIKKRKSDIDYFANAMMKYAYNIFFNAGEDFEEQYVSSRNTLLIELIEKVLNGKMISNEDYFSLISLNTDINNSWIFIISNVIIVKSMNNFPIETYEMLYHFFDKVQFEVQVQHLDFYLSSAFWSLYINEPCDRNKFETLFEKIADKYERILFMFPNSPRIASINKFSEEFERIFEDGFNPIAFYFYTAPYRKCANSSVEWNRGKTDLKEYWKLVQRMLDLGKYDDILRIVHALGQMISIYPVEGYSALENLAHIEHPIIKDGIIRIFKENYLRYSNITKEELRKSIYHFGKDEIEEIEYNTDFLLENRTLEQLHWGRLFYNLEKIFKINISEIFLSKFLNSNSCLNFFKEFIFSAGDK